MTEHVQPIWRLILENNNGKITHAAHKNWSVQFPLGSRQHIYSLFCRNMNCTSNISQEIFQRKCWLHTQLLCHSMDVFSQDNISYSNVTCKLGILNCLYFLELYLRSEQSGTGRKQPPDSLVPIKQTLLFAVCINLLGLNTASVYTWKNQVF